MPNAGSFVPSTGAHLVESPWGLIFGCQRWLCKEDSRWRCLLMQKLQPQAPLAEGLDSAFLLSFPVGRRPSAPPAPPPTPGWALPGGALGGALGPAAFLSPGPGPAPPCPPPLTCSSPLLRFLSQHLLDGGGPTLSSHELFLTEGSQQRERVSGGRLPHRNTTWWPGLL